LKFNIAFIAIAISASALFACNNGKNSGEDVYKKPADAQEAGTAFIRSTLNGNDNLAKEYMLQDTSNLTLLERWKAGYDRLPEADKFGYKQSNIIIAEIKNINDSVSIINYMNSFKKQPQELKIVRQKGDWLVDFKHTSHVSK
jgi:hypothetical protein